MNNPLGRKGKLIMCMVNRRSFRKHQHKRLRRRRVDRTLKFLITLPIVHCFLSLSFSLILYIVKKTKKQIHEYSYSSKKKKNTK